MYDLLVCMARSGRNSPTQEFDSYGGADLSPEELEAANAERSPSEQLSTTPRCGARVAAPSTKGIPQDEALQLQTLRRVARDQGLTKSDLGHPDYTPPDEPLPPPATCKQPAGYGTPHLGFGYCKFHGGNTAAGRKAGAKAAGRALIATHRQELVNAERFAGHRDSPENDITPEMALLEEVRRSVAMVRWIEERIGMWDVPSLSELDDSPSKGGGSPGLGGLPELMTETIKGTPMATDAHSWLILYREERAHMIKVSKLAIDSGVQERMVKIAEQQGQMLTVAIRAVLHALNLTQDQQTLVPTIVPEILRQVATATPQITVNGEVVS
jgi:hypothetical protein